MLTLENCSFHAHIQPTIDYTSTLFASANTLKPLASIHKGEHKLTHLNSTSLTTHDYKGLDVLLLKLKLEFNKGIIIHKIVTSYASSTCMVDRTLKSNYYYCYYSTLKFNFHSNQNRHSHKRIVPRPRLDLFKCSLMYAGGNIWNNLPLRIKFWQITKHLKRHLKNT